MNTGARVTEKRCLSCAHYRADPEGIRFPSGTGICEVLRRADGSADPRRTHEGNRCPKWKKG